LYTLLEICFARYSIGLTSLAEYSLLQGRFAVFDLVVLE
jgi:hypothetical protein